MTKFKYLLLGLLGALVLFFFAFTVYGVTPQNQATGGTATSTKFTTGALIYQNANSYGGEIPIAGSNITINTSTPGQITFSASGGVPSNGTVNQILGNSATNVPAWLNSTSTAILSVDVNRTDSYTSNGSYLFPYKSLSAAIASSTGYSGYAYNLAPGTYVDGPPDTFPNSPFTLHGNQSTYVPASGVTFQNSFDIYDLTIAGNVVEGDNNLQTIHQFNNGVITGNLSVAGLATLSGEVLSGTTTTFTTQSGALSNFAEGESMASIISNGTLNLNDMEELASTTSYAVISTTTGSVLDINGMTLIQNGSGGGINVQNGATSTVNNISNLTIISNSTTPGSTLNAGTAATFLCNYNDTNFVGTTIYALGSNWIPCIDGALTVQTKAQLGVASTSAGSLVLQNAVNGFTTTITSSSSQTSNLTLNLPPTAGSAGQALTTNGSGTLYWSTISGGSGNSAWTINNGWIQNATSTDAVEIGNGSTTPIAGSLVVSSAGTTTPSFTLLNKSGQPAIEMRDGGAGNQNTLIGYQAGKIVSASNNTAIGYQSLTANTIGGTNTALGSLSAGLLRSGAAGNVFIGYESGYSNSPSFNATNNVAVGANSLQSNPHDYNTAIGANSLSQTNGTNNTAIGYNTGYSSTSGGGNVFIGYNSGYNFTASNQFTVNDIQESSIANDQNYSLLYGTFSGAATSLSGQFLDTNGVFNVNTTTLASVVTIQATSSASTVPLLNIATSSGNSILQVLANQGIALSMDASSTNSSTTVASTVPVLQLGSAALSTPRAGGTYIGINAPSNSNANFFDFQQGGTSYFACSTRNLSQTYCAFQGNNFVLNQNSNTTNLEATTALNISINGTNANNILTINTTNPLLIASTTGNSLLQILGNNGAVLSTNASSTNSSTTVLSSSPVLALGSIALSGPSANGTFIGVNTPSTFSGNFEQYQLNGSSKFTVSSTGAITAAATASINGMSVGANVVLGTGNTTLFLRGPGLSGAAGSSITMDDAGDNRNPTSGTSDLLLVSDAQPWNPTSGTGVINNIELDGMAINQTSTANGITRDVYLNPTVTSAYDYRNLEVAPIAVTLSNAANPISVGYNTLINPITYSTASSSVYTVATTSSIDIKGLPIASTKVLLTNSAGLLVEPNALNASTTNAYGAYVMAPTGASHNYSGNFEGGNFGIGTTTPTFGFVNNGTAQFSNIATASSGLSGYACFDANNQLVDDSALCITVSARRFKENIKPLTPVLAELMALNPVSFNYKPDTKLPSQLQYGLIADDVAKVDPNLAVYTATTTQFEGKIYPSGTPEGLAPDNTWIGLLVESIQEQQKEIQGIKGITRSAEENWQWIAIGLLALGFVFQQIQINKLRK